MKNFLTTVKMILMVWAVSLTFSLSSCTESRGEGTQKIDVGGNQTVAALLPRKNETEGKEEYTMLRNRYEEAVKTLKEKGFDSKAYITLASIYITCLLYTSPSPRDRTRSRMPSSA